MQVVDFNAKHTAWTTLVEQLDNFIARHDLDIDPSDPEYTNMEKTVVAVHAICGALQGVARHTKYCYVLR